MVLRLMLAGELTVEESAAEKPAKAKQRDQAIGGFKPRWDNRPNEGSPNE
jgi:hypothetical protein